MRFVSICILLMLVGLTGSAFAAQAVSTADGSPLDYLRPVIEAFTTGNPLAGGALAVVFLCAVARRYMPATWKEGTRGDIIGVATTFTMAFFGHAAIALKTSSLSLALFGPSFHVGLLAIGGFTVIHKVAGWIAAWPKAPSWLVAVLRVLTAVVGSSAVKKAEAAGAKAVAADPPKGLKGDSAIVEVE